LLFQFGEPRSFRSDLIFTLLHVNVSTIDLRVHEPSPQEVFATCRKKLYVQTQTRSLDATRMNMSDITYARDIEIHRDETSLFPHWKSSAGTSSTFA